MNQTPFAFMGSTAAEGPGWGTPPYDTGIQVFYDFGSDDNGQTVSWDPSTNTVNDVENFADATWVPQSGNTFLALSGSGYGAGVAQYSVSTKQGQYLDLTDDANFPSSQTAVSFEWIYKTPTGGLSQDNVLARYTNGNFSTTALESNLQQYGGSPVADRWYADITDQSGGNPGTIYWYNTFSADTFYHLVLTAEQNGKLKAYAQGVLVEESSTNYQPTSVFTWSRNNAVIFGSDSYSGGVILGGLGCFRMYNTAIPAASVTANYNYFSAKF